MDHDPPRPRCKHSTIPSRPQSPDVALTTTFAHLVSVGPYVTLPVPDAGDLYKPPIHSTVKMSYSFITSSAASYSYSFSAPAAPHAFAFFGQSPRDNYTMYEDLRSVLRPSSAHTHIHTQSPSKKSGLRKFFGVL
ncbi:hypothetical protein OF83DRAFT_1174689 [Amylostereum chailletii]|nr:hypothetical protein OF83DRAFT_1174689 [Amylostereum chailletii]